MAPVVGGAFDSQGLAVFFDRSQLEVIKVLIEQEVGRITTGRRDQASEPGKLEACEPLRGLQLPGYRRWGSTSRN